MILLQVLEVLHGANVNVANINIGRQNKSIAAALSKQIQGQNHGSNSNNASELVGNNDALCIMALDDDVPTNVLNYLKSLPALKHVSKIQLR